MQCKGQGSNDIKKADITKVRNAPGAVNSQVKPSKVTSQPIRQPQPRSRTTPHSAHIKAPFQTNSTLGVPKRSSTQQAMVTGRRPASARLNPQNKNRNIVAKSDGNMGAKSAVRKTEPVVNKADKITRTCDSMSVKSDSASLKHDGNLDSAVMQTNDDLGSEESLDEGSGVNRSSPKSGSAQDKSEESCSLECSKEIQRGVQEMKISQAHPKKDDVENQTTKEPPFCLRTNG